MEEVRYISKIESFFCDLLGKKLSDNVFFSELPAPLNGTWETMVVVDCGDAIENKDAYGTGTVLVWMYARPRGDGSKDVAAIHKMETALRECINSNSSKDYYVSFRRNYSGYDQQRSLFYNIAALDLLTN